MFHASVIAFAAYARITLWLIIMFCKRYNLVDTSLQICLNSQMAHQIDNENVTH